MTKIVMYVYRIRIRIENCVSLAFKPFYEDTSSVEGSRVRATNYIAGDEKN